MTVVATVEITKLRDVARSAYGDMQKSWYVFAKAICEIRDTESFRGVVRGRTYVSFKDYCLSEFPDIKYSTISKFTTIVEKMSPALDAKLEREPRTALPGFTTCHQLLASEKSLPEEEFKKLKRGVLDSRVSYHSLCARIKEVVGKAREKSVRKSSDEIERELLEEIRADEIDETDDIEVSDTGVEPLIHGLISRVGYIRENLPRVSGAIDASPEAAGGVAVDLAEELESLMEQVELFLGKMEEAHE